MQFKVSIIILCVTTLIACHDKKGDSLKRVNSPDPFAESFYGSKIKAIIGYDKQNPDDTVEISTLDADGNIVTTESFMKSKRWDFDSRHFVVREQSRGDVYWDYAITYTLGVDKYVQHWTGIDYTEWEFDSTMLSSTDTFSMSFDFDSEGYVIARKNPRRSVYTIFSYDSSKHLVNATTFGMADHDVSNEFAYIYRNGILRQVTYTIEGTPYLIHYFSSVGLLDSTVYEDQTVLYKFHYFE